ncbi:plasminogen-like [Micropterus salmoides]|uniref:plasminogen-like n=1 Tax=Micropterus salmoides TaxID=27706 RepID=UPI0018EE0000|nr:plasminogen-like [Micropterus salmoides]
MMLGLQMFLLFHVLTCFGGNALRSEIINGKKTKAKSMKYMASVQNNKGHVCGGFLISEDFVVTAAHCDDKNPTSVVLGTHNLKKVDDKTMRYTVKRCKHPSYKRLESGNDIMLLKLSRKARPSKKVLIKPIQLPSRQINLKENQNCKVAGWGLTRTGGQLVNDLQEVDVPIIKLEKCQKAWHNILPDNIICAGGYGTKKGFCQGDSGGPLVYKGKIAVGVVSFNSKNNCNYPDVPNIYTDISKFLPWIKEILQKKKCKDNGLWFHNCDCGDINDQVCSWKLSVVSVLHQDYLTVQRNAWVTGKRIFEAGCKTRGSEIINGKNTPENSMLYMASVQNNMGHHICGGFLISEDFVVTAAHCDDKMIPLSVVLGTHDLKKVDNNTMRYSVKRCKRPSYSKPSSGSDIMLLKLSKKAQLGKRVRLILLTKADNKIKDKEKCRVAGWGWTQTHGKAVDVLKMVDVPFVNLEVCKKEWAAIGLNLPANVICAGGYGTNKGFCQGDSGGPLVCSGKAVGVVSFNMRKNCDYPNVPNVYTDISKYLPWIKNVLKKKDC